MDGTNGLRSARWFGGARSRRASSTAPRCTPRASRARALDGRPVVGICNSWSELVNCNLHFRGLAEAVKRGVLQAGGLPLEFPTISLGENLMKPTTMLFRNLMAMDVEECDPRLSARRRRAARRLRQDGARAADGRRQRGRAGDHGHRRPVAGRRASAAAQLGAGTDLWHYADELRAGRMSAGGVRRAGGRGDAVVRPLQRDGHRLDDDGARRGARHVACPGTATIPAVDAAPRARRRGDRARARSSSRAEGLRPSQILTAGGVRQRDHAADGARRRRRTPSCTCSRSRAASASPLTLDRFDELSRRDAAARQRAAVRRAPRRAPAPRRRRPGGAAASSRRCSHGEALTVTGADARRRARRRRGARPRRDRARSTSRSRPRAGSRSLRGSLAPARRRHQAQRRLAATCSRHRGPRARVRGRLRRRRAHRRPRARRRRRTRCSCCATAARRAARACPSGGSCRSRASCSRAGVTDMVRISDARMSGTAFGTVVLHVAPESAAGGPLARRPRRRPDRARRRRAPHRPRRARPTRSRARLAAPRRPPSRATRAATARCYLDHVLQADEGCDFDFLRARPDEPGRDRAATACSAAGSAAGEHGRARPAGVLPAAAPRRHAGRGGGGGAAPRHRRCRAAHGPARRDSGAGVGTRSRRRRRRTWRRSTSCGPCARMPAGRNGPTRQHRSRARAFASRAAATAAPGSAARLARGRSSGRCGTASSSPFSAGSPSRACRTPLCRPAARSFSSSPSIERPPATGGRIPAPAAWCTSRRTRRRTSRCTAACRSRR